MRKAAGDVKAIRTRLESIDREGPGGLHRRAILRALKTTRATLRERRASVRRLRRNLERHVRAITAPRIRRPAGRPSTRSRSRIICRAADRNLLEWAEDVHDELGFLMEDAKRLSRRKLRPPAFAAPDEPAHRPWGERDYETGERRPWDAVSILAVLRRFCEETGRPARLADLGSRGGVDLPSLASIKRHTGGRPPGGQPSRSGLDPPFDHLAGRGMHPRSLVRAINGHRLSEKWLNLPFDVRSTVATPDIWLNQSGLRVLLALRWVGGGSKSRNHLPPSGCAGGARAA